MSKGIVLVTGASSGIGEACADLLARGGWTVVGLNRRSVSGRGWTSLVVDVDSDESVLKGISGLISEYGRIDAVVACAGWGLAGAVEQTSLLDAKAQFETNFWGCVRVVQPVLGQMRQQGRGQIVLMSSIGGIIGIPFQAFYSASKFALEGYAEALAYEVEPFNISITLVEPGNFKTGFTNDRRTSLVHASEHDDPYYAARTKAVNVMERDELQGADPAAVARSVLKILSSTNPRRRVSVGKFDERIGLMAKRLLPFKLFSKAARSSLGV